MALQKPEGWDKLCQMTKSSDVFKKRCDMDEHVEISYQNWKKKFNSILHACFEKKRIVPNKRPYNAEIRSLLKEKKVIKRKLQASKNSYLYRRMIAKIRKLHRKIVSILTVNCINYLPLALPLPPLLSHLPLSSQSSLPLL